jgi:hypothetical protein
VRTVVDGDAIDRRRVTLAAVRQLPRIRDRVLLVPEMSAHPLLDRFMYISAIIPD